jgi:hypothetical protein
MSCKHYWEVDRETAKRYWAIHLKIYSSIQDRRTLAEKWQSCPVVHRAPRRRIFKDVSVIDDARLASSVKSGLRRNKILAGVEIDRITFGIDPDRLT